MIEFDNVSFAYESGAPVIKGLSFRIEDGESVGLIGAN
jgi:ABC-type multidrug transport system fused ATPase/permease subunit